MDHHHTHEHQHTHHNHADSDVPAQTKPEPYQHKPEHHRLDHPPIKRQTTHHVCDELEALKCELNQENQHRNHAQLKYSDLKRQIDVFDQCCDESKKHPESKYDTFIIKQNCINDNLYHQIREAKEKLANLTQSLKNFQICGKALCCSTDCNLNMKDLCIDYNCISKSELTKEIKRFERMQVDLKSTLDRLQWRLDCESKVYYNLLDQFQKLQIELYYLQNLGDRYCHKELCT